MTGVPDTTLDAYKEKVEERCPGAQLDILTKDNLTEVEAIEQMKGYDAIMSGFQPMTERIYAETDLKAFIACSIGYDFTNVEAATKHHVVVTNNPSYCFNEVAEHVCALILACNRGIVKMDRAVRDGQWGFPLLAPQFTLKGSTIAFFGYGRISRAAAKKLSGFDVNVIAYDPYVNEEDVKDDDVTLVTFEELVAQGDYIVIQALLNEETEGIFNAEVFKKMKDTAYLINTARGPLVNQKDLYEALENGDIRGAALDVLAHEPLGEEEKKLVALPNVICTGHSAFYSEESLALQTELTVDNIVRFLKGEKLHHIVNPEVLEHIDWMEK